jgi:hypothetical protein
VATVCIHGGTSVVVVVIVVSPLSGFGNTTIGTLYKHDGFLGAISKVQNLLNEIAFRRTPKIFTKQLLPSQVHGCQSQITNA